jgi:signal transduction histidine kinase
MSLRGRLLAAFAYVLVLTIVALEVPLALNVSRRVDAEIKSEAASGTQIVASSAAGSLGRTRELERLAAAAAGDLGGRVIVVDRRGRLVADSAGEGLGGASYAGRPEVATALRGRTAQGTRRSESLDQELLYTAVPIMRGARPVGAVRVTQSVAAVRSEMRSDALALIGIGAVVLALGLALAWFLADSIAKPLRGLADAARGVAAGDLRRRAPQEGSREQREVAAAFNDMTVRVEQALNSQRDFVANASHQLRTPLTGLRLRLESAGLKSADPGVRRDIEAAERETERLARLLNGLLALARERADPPEVAPLSLAGEVAAAVDRWRAPAEGNGSRLLVEDGEDALVRISPDDLAVILDNLIENAIEHGGPASDVTIEWMRGGEIAELAVSDCGPGVPHGEEERVFERFHRAAGGDVPGTGLGLPIVRALAERWGGAATISNRPAGGARAEVLLRCAPAAPPGPSSGARNATLQHAKDILDRELGDALPTGG